MKIIFSRKGFDDAYGKAANLILPDGRLVVFPIPEHAPHKGIEYGQIQSNGSLLQEYFSQLNITLPSDHTGAHLDPDIDINATSRAEGWRPVFGSHGAANAHLINQGVGTGDLFLYFGSFRHVFHDKNGSLCYVKGPAIHLLFGWLKVGQRIDNPFLWGSTIPEWTRSHSHVINNYGKSNSIYLSDFRENGEPDAGVLSFREDRILTKEGLSKSFWSLPSFFHPDHGTVISRHSRQDRFNAFSDHVELKTVSIGQDFVVKSERPEVIEWAMNRIS